MNVKPVWTYQSSVNVISTPVVVNYDEVVFGNQNGMIESLGFSTGKKKWSFQTAGPVFSSPAEMNGDIAVGSADGSVYCLSEDGKLRWKFKTNASVLGSPLIENGAVYMVEVIIILEQSILKRVI